VGDEVGPCRRARAPPPGRSRSGEGGLTAAPAPRTPTFSPEQSAGSAPSWDSVPTIRTAPPTVVSRRPRQWWPAAMAGAIALFAGAIVLLRTDRVASPAGPATEKVPSPIVRPTSPVESAAPIPTAIPSPAAG